MSEGPALRIRRAVAADLPAIVRLIADDPIGREREHGEGPLPPSYAEAFREIDADPAHELIVAERDGEIVATLQLTVIPNLTFAGGRRALIEAVHVDRRLRGRRIGEAIMRWAIARARERGCRLAQLTSDLRRSDAKRFYERLGFVPSHVGMKLRLDGE